MSLESTETSSEPTEGAGIFDPRIVKDESGNVTEYKTDAEAATMAEEDPFWKGYSEGSNTMQARVTALQYAVGDTTEARIASANELLAWLTGLPSQV